MKILVNIDYVREKDCTVLVPKNNVLIEENVSHILGTNLGCESNSLQSTYFIICNISNVRLTLSLCV